MSQMMIGNIPHVNEGGGPVEAQFAHLDYTQMTLDAENRNPKQKERERQRQLIDTGTVSALDLAAPAKAVSEFNNASSLMSAQCPQEAIAHLQKAIAIYPSFVSAHNDLGLAYLDLEDPVRAQGEFEMAAKLDEKFWSLVSVTSALPTIREMTSVARVFRILRGRCTLMHVAMRESSLTCRSHCVFQDSYYGYC